ncbi:MAG: 6-bladed beta-propeller [Candidatus Aminicenantales bacterium]
MKSRSPWFAWLAAASFIFGFALHNALARQKTEFKTENGVVIVSNPKKPAPKPGGPSQLLLKEDLVIGREAPAGEYLFAQLRAAGVDARESIWTLDPKDLKVRVFDKMGKLISTFGRKGQGPGEWESPNRMTILPEGTGVILDANKITFYSLEGKCVKEISTAKTNMTRFKIDSKGTIYGDRMDFGERIMYRLVKFDQSLTPVATLADIEEPIKPGAYSPFPIFIFFHVTGDDRLIWMSNATYAFHVLSPAGNPLKTITKDYEAVRITAEDRKTILEGFKDNPSYQKMIVFPAVYPPAYYFVGDEEGRLFAQTYEKDDKGWLLFDAFDTDGRCVARFSLPKEESIFAVRKNKLYVMIQEDAEGRPLVKRYAMEWK